MPEVYIGLRPNCWTLRPREIVNRLNAELIKIAAMPDTKENMQNAGVEPMSGTPEQLSEFIKTEIVRWAKVIKEANIATIDSTDR